MSIERAIGILGGTFDPIHHGHLRLALEMREKLQLTEIRFIPCKTPVHKSAATLSGRQRVALLKLALKDESSFQLDLREIQRKTPSYMLETLQSLRSELPRTPLCLIIGTDAWLDFSTWHHWETIFEFAHIVVAQRAGHALPTTTHPMMQIMQQRRATQPEQLHTQLAGLVLLQEITALEISSTAIRQQLSKQQSPRYLLPDNVLRAIQKRNLYFC